MSSSSRSRFQRDPARVARRGKPLRRSESSSLFGTLKNIVTRPLSWFATDSKSEFADDSTNGKRRRVGDEPAPAQVDAGESAAASGDGRTKRMRLDSPDRTTASVDAPFNFQSQVYSPPQQQQGYLDPPRTAFQQMSFGHGSFSDMDTRMDTGTGRQTVSPRRALGRTMSMDPPAFPNSQSSSMSFTTSGSFSSQPRSNLSFTGKPFTRDAQTLPLETTHAPSPSPFRMRTMTPAPAASAPSQPSFSQSNQGQRALSREGTDPPPLNALRAQPTFIRPPSEGLSGHGQARGAESGTNHSQQTLGGLVDNYRSTRSPVRQHSTLFGTAPARPLSDMQGPANANAAERALHELDIYKTPLLPTRLRSSFSAGASEVGNSVPSIFRASKGDRFWVGMGMEDDGTEDSKSRRKRKGKKVKGEKGEKDKKEKAAKDINRTKPYAGEGGMKKLLARRRLEEQEEQGPSPEKEEDRPAVPVQAPLPPPIPVTKPDLPPAPSAASGSSLRVGRTRRNHNPIARPISRPSASKNRFSAAGSDDEDDLMGAGPTNGDRGAVIEDVDEEDEAERRREKELKELDEAQKRAPAFEIPAGFSFAKEPPKIEQDGNAKEPPIPSLPFSFGAPPSKPVQTQPPVIFGAAPSQKEEPTRQQTESASTSQASQQDPQPQSSTLPTLQPPPQILPESQPWSSSSSIAPIAPIAAAPPATPSGIPNFFANSPALSSSAASTPPPPTKDAENPLWEGDSKAAEKPTPPTPSLFGGAPTSVFGSTPAPTSLFGAPPASQEPPKVQVASPLFGGAQPSSSKPAEQATTPFSFGAPKPVDLPKTEEPKPADGATKPPPLFGPTPGISAPSFTGFGTAPSVTNVAPSTDASKPTLASTFSFGQTAATPDNSAPKPLFGAGGGFSFGQPSTSSVPTATTTNKDTSKTPFSFGASPATPPAAAENKSPFSFGAPAAAPATGFSFGGASSNAQSTTAGSSSSFSFGGGPARPVTPPRKETNEYSMEESPTRDINLNGSKEVSAPASTGFSFGASAPSTSGSLFGGNTNASSPFSFGAPSTSGSTSNIFGPKLDTKLEAKPPAFGGFGQQSNPPSAAGSGFSFGPPKPETEQPRPSTGGPFSFGQPTAPEPIERRPSSSGPFSFGQPAPTLTTTGTSFGFGSAPSSNTGNANPFGQATSNAGSAPNSPSTFAQQPSFSFAAPTPTAAPSNPFSFGSSQPASPANGNSTLPVQTPTTPSGGGGSFTFGGGAPTTSPFNAPQGLSAPSTSGSLFTIGAAPPAANRNIKKLPNRRGARKA